MVSTLNLRLILHARLLSNNGNIIKLNAAPSAFGEAYNVTPASILLSGDEAENGGVTDASALSLLEYTVNPDKVFTSHAFSSAYYVLCLYRITF